VLNVAVTLLSPDIVTTQVPVVLVQAPDHPAKVELVSGFAVRVTDVPLVKAAPTGAEVTMPVPVPAGVTVRLYIPVAFACLNVIVAVAVVVFPSFVTL
jgi:hypothetical protein